MRIKKITHTYLISLNFEYETVCFNSYKQRPRFLKIQCKIESNEFCSLYKDKINYCYILKFHLEQPSTAQTAFES